MKKILLGLFISSAAYAGNINTPIVPANGGTGLTGQVSSAQFGFLSTTTSDVQTQLNGKQASLGFTPANKAGDTFLGGVTVPSFNDSGLTSSTALATDANDNLVSSSTTATELGYVHGVTASIQTQINAISAGSMAQGPNGAIQYSNGSGLFQASSSLTYLSSILSAPGISVSGLLSGATVNVSGLTPSSAIVTDGGDNLISSSTSSVELGYVHGVTNSIQPQLNALAGALGPPAIITITTANSPYPALANQFIICNGSGGTISINLPTTSVVDPNSSGGAGYLGDIGVASNTAGTVVINANGGDTGGINGLSSVTLSVQSNEKDFKASKANLEWFAH